MNQKTMKKLQLRKEVISKLNKSNMQHIVGGALETINLSCGALCTSTRYDCTQLPAEHQPTFWHPMSFPDGPTCGGGVCGSDTGCPTTGYTNEICSGEISVCLC